MKIPRKLLRARKKLRVTLKKRWSRKSPSKLLKAHKRQRKTMPRALITDSTRAH
jgi:hypothetical protein